MFKISCIVTCLISLIAAQVAAQQDPVSRNRGLIPENTSLDFAIAPAIYIMGSKNDGTKGRVYFPQVTYSALSDLPSWTLFKILPAGTTHSIPSIDSPVYMEVNDDVADFLRPLNLGEYPNIESVVGLAQKKPVCNISIIPFRVNEKTGIIEQLISFNLKFENYQIAKKSAVRNYAANSVLSTGEWYKIGVTEEGVCKITGEFLSSLGIDLSQLSRDKIMLFGNGGGMLSEINADYRLDDLHPIAVDFSGSDNGTFNLSDKIIFYGESPHKWKKDGDSFRHELNLYSDTTYYFLNIDADSNLEMDEEGQAGNSVGTITSFNGYAYYEKEAYNLIKSGRVWYGDSYNTVTTNNYNFQLPHMVSGTEMSILTSVAARTISQSSNFSIRVNGGVSELITLSGVTSSYTGPYASTGSKVISTNAVGSVLDIQLSFEKGNSSAIGWLDKIEVNARRELQYNGIQLHFRDLNSVDTIGANKTFSISTNTKLEIMDITDPLVPHYQISDYVNGKMLFTASVDSLHEYVAFVPSKLNVPKSGKRISNQDLHGSVMRFPDLLIITNSAFLTEATELGEWHSTQDELEVMTVTTQQIFNEFSSGKQDITALKDFVKMFYDQAGTDTSKIPRYLLLFGDGSYDLKGRISGNTNYIPSYHSRNSLTPTSSYVSDDYFGLLDDHEGSSTADFVDIGIGRLPVKSKLEAKNMVAKIKSYYKANSMQDWRNDLVFVGDDEDNNLHMKQINNLTIMVDSTYPDYNIDKIYYDAYPQIANAGGDRYPDAKAALNKRVNLGTLILTYVGHGGELGWGHERVLEVSDINNWSNLENLPLFLTATCEFSRYDDPQRTSAGEYVLLNPSGGGIGLLTTTRLVYTAPNEALINSFYNVVFEPINGNMPRIGDVCRLTKVGSPRGVNTRNFTLLGDPAIRLAYPQEKIYTSNINSSAQDTIMALGYVTVTGFVGDQYGVKRSDFNGIVYPTVFDKKLNIQTLNNDGNGAYNFDLQKNVIFKGKATVRKGDFEYSFVVPKDINYDFGQGRVSYYAENGEYDAHGNEEDFIIGGIDPNAEQDEIGPQVDLYMNNDEFVFGGMTDENPDLFALIYDKNGVNTVGNGIGHDLVAILDENTSSTIILNDYYESDLDSYQSGKIRYPFTSLSEGIHHLKVRVWDVHNNSGEGYTEFIVTKNAKFALAHVLNYPNPFSTNTNFYFEHNQPGKSLDIRIQIFSVSGKLVKTIDGYDYGDGYRVGPISWNGLDDYGDKLGNGVYVYKLKVIAASGEVIDKYEKLVILN